MHRFSWGSRLSMVSLLASLGWTSSEPAARKKHKHDHLLENYYAPRANAKRKPRDFPLGTRDWQPTEPHPWLKHLRSQAEEELFEQSIQPGEYAVVAHAKDNTRFSNIFNNVAHKLFDENHSMSTFKCAIRYLEDDKHHIVDAKVWISSPEYTDFDTKDHPNHHNGRIWYTGRSAMPQLLQWSRHHSYPLISHRFSSEKFGWPSIRDKGHWNGSVSIFLRDQNSSNPLWPGLEQSLRPLMLHYRWQLRFVTADLSTLDEHTLHQFGGHNESEPLITVFKDRRRYTLEGEAKLRDTDVVRRFLEDAVEHRLKPSFKSERFPPKEVDEKGLVYLTGDNFERYVFDETRDVLVWFDHLEKCRYIKESTRSTRVDRCQEAYKAFEELFERQSEDMRANLTIGRFDDSKNDCIEDLANTRPPSFVLYPAVPADQKLEKKRVFTGTTINAKSIAAWARQVSTHLQVINKGKAPKLVPVELKYDL